MRATRACIQIRGGLFSVLPRNLQRTKHAIHVSNLRVDRPECLSLLLRAVLRLQQICNLIAIQLKATNVHLSLATVDDSLFAEA